MPLPRTRTPRTVQVVALAIAASLLAALMIGCGLSGTEPRRPDGSPPTSDAVRRISAQLENAAAPKDEELVLWAIAFDAVHGWSYPYLPRGRMMPDGAIAFELPAELPREKLLPFASLCGAGLQLSDPEAAGLLSPFLVAESEEIVIQTSSPACLSRPTNGDLLAVRLYSDRPLQIAGSCRGGPLAGGQLDLVLHRGWNLIVVELAGLPLRPRPIVWTGAPPAGVGWYVAHRRAGD